MSFAYHDNPDYVAQTPKDPNAWFRRTTETRADGSEVAVYCNAFGQTMLRVERDGADEWVRYTRFDARGRAILDANPSAVSGYDESLTDLVGYDEHTRAAAHLRADAGLISTTSYHPDGSEAAGLAASRGLSRGTGGGGGAAANPGVRAARRRRPDGAAPVAGDGLPQPGRPRRVPLVALRRELHVLLPRLPPGHGAGRREDHAPAVRAGGRGRAGGTGEVPAAPCPSVVCHWLRQCERRPTAPDAVTCDP